MCLLIDKKSSVSIGIYKMLEKISEMLGLLFSLRSKEGVNV